MHATPARLTASAHACARSTLKSTGFSQKIALPAAAERVMRSECVSVDDPITTAPTALSASAVSTLATCAPCCCASDFAAAASTSTT